MTQTGVTAITPDDAESCLAALLFDYVIPVWGADNVPSSIVCPSLDIDTLKSDNYPFIFAARESINSAKRILGVKELTDDQTKNLACTHMARRLYHLAENKDIRVCAAFQEPFMYSTYYGSGESSVIQIAIDGLRLPDTKELTWEQVLEIRKDKNFHKRLRDLRLYIDRQFEGKNRSYILDRLEQDLESYEHDARKHGLKLAAACTKKVLSAETALSAAGAATVAMIAGQPATIAALAGVVIPLASLTIEVSEIATTLRSKIRNPELAFLAEIKKM